MITEQGKYYLYRHVRLDKHEPFYIGIGTKRTRYGKLTETDYNRAFAKKNRNRIWNGIIRKTNYKVEILVESNNRKLIAEKEIEFINLYGFIISKSGSLCNLTNGGELWYRPINDKKVLRFKDLLEKGFSKADIIKQEKTSDYFLNKIIKLYNINYIKHSFKEYLNNNPKYNHSEETKLKISTASKNFIRTSEWCNNISLGKKNKIPVVCNNLDGSFYKEFECLSDASYYFNNKVCNTANISNVIKNGKKYKNKYWKLKVI